MENLRSDYLVLAGACDQVVRGLEVVDRTLAFVAERASVEVAVIREAALRQDAAPEIVAAADRLLQRVRGPASSA
jgi:hypothetical protein